MPRHHTYYITATIFSRFIITVLALTSLYPMYGVTTDRSAIKANTRLLQQLDSLIAGHDAIISRKETRIAVMRADLNKAAGLRDKIEKARALYNEYHVYDPDSALYYARMASGLASRIKPADPDLAASCLLDQAFIYASQGFIQEADHYLSMISSADLSSDMKIKFYQTGQYIYSTQALYNNDAKDKTDPCAIKANAYRDSLVRLYHGREMPQALWVPIAIRIDSEKYDPPLQEVRMLEKAVESTTVPSRDNAINSYWLARHYFMTGDEAKAVRYMTMAAIYDAEIENREIAAITELANWLFSHNDIDRAYKYLIYSSDQANAYHNRARVINIGTVLPSVREAYRHAILDRDRKLQRYLWMLIGLAVVLAICVAFIIVENRKIRRTRRDLADMNSRLADSNSRLAATVTARDEAIMALEKANAALSATNTVLIQANKEKQGLMALAFRLTSDYINALEEFRKKLLRKFRQKEYADMGVILDDPELIREQYKDFYVAFDHTMLSIFPDLIEEYNAGAPREAQTDVESTLKSRTLNTRLRIHALRRLGIDKSADIARMLNVSIRTVYNNRF